jgi:small subunit ribosomal protein S11
MANANPVRVRKKIKSKITEGVVCVLASFNNTIITVTDKNGNVLCWATSGGSGFRGSRKGTPFAAQVAVDKVAPIMREFEMKRVEVRISGPGPGRDSALRMLDSCKFQVVKVIDVTPLPHNGCRPPKRRRV